MKYVILSLALFFSYFSFSQQLIVTPSGLRSSTEIDKSFIVIDCGNLAALDLYKNATKFINENYKNPKEVIKGQTEGEYLKFDSYVQDFLNYNNSGVKIPIEATYTIELRFKEGKVKFEVVALEMISKKRDYKVLFSGGLFDGYIIYKKNGTLFKEETKRDVENYFNNQIILLQKYLLGNNSTNDW